MKQSYFYLTLLCSLTLSAQAPTTYYNSANGLTGYALKTELSTIITNGYNERTYGELLTLYQTSDIDVYYENDNTILDMYSERPAGVDAYSYTFNQNCGATITNEGDCYNREHIFPQGFFNQRQPMRSDAHHVVPSDGFVNGRRSNLPFGMVGTNPETTSNGSKRGFSITTGFTGEVFEPIDEFKGDIARALLYFATRYEANFNDTTWDSSSASPNDPRDGTQNRWYEQWYINLLLDWHAQDPVSQKEIDRNNAVFVYQNNRNPYVDNPQWVTAIWSNAAIPTGSIFATLTDTFTDVDNSNSATVGDIISYSYVITNLGSSTLFNVTAIANFGTFTNPVQLGSIAPAQSLTDPLGSLSYTLTATDINTSCNCLRNKLVVSANFNAAGTNGSLVINSDDPDNAANVDANGDSLPDDITTTLFPGTPPGGGGVATELFISEYIEGSGLNKAIEIANYTGNTVNLSDYSLQRDTNGIGTWSGAITLSGSLATNDVFVIAQSAANAAIVGQADLLVGSGTALDFNGNDPVGLFKNGVLLDIVGVFGTNSNFAQNTTLVRMPTVSSPTVNFDLVNEWIVFTQDNSTDLGAHLFSGTAGIADSLQNALQLYPNPSQGFFTIKGLDSFMNVTVYDLAGRTVQFERQDSTISNLKSGLYIVKVAQANSAAFIKVIVQ